MSSDLPAISVRGLSKEYRLGEQRGPARLSEALSSPFGRRQRDRRDPWFKALDDVSFDVAPGTALGIVGRNGAGKSTLLKVLSRITRPTSGNVVLRGRVGSLLEVGTGFHPELTGRENVYMNGAMLGMRRAEITGKFDEIVSFADIERFIDTPVKRYSSGMYVRLAFAVAAHLEPEILLIDEVLAVGDVAFQRKCLGKMGQVAGDGRTVLFVSHNTAAVQQLTTRCVLLDAGALVASGSTTSVLATFLDLLGDVRGGEQDLRGARRLEPAAPRDIEMLSLGLRGDTNGVLASAQDIELDVTVQAHVSMPRFSFSLTVFGHDGHPVGSGFSGTLTPPRRGGTGRYTLRICGVCLAPGRYYLGLSTASGDVSDAGVPFDMIGHACDFEVAAPTTPDGAVSTWPPAWGSVLMTVAAAPASRPVRATG